MIRPEPFRYSERGFTVIEVMAALLVFSLLTVGLAPLLATSIKGSELSQSYAVGKNFALEAMERVRTLPYYVAFETQPDGRPVDVLDLYYPTYLAGDDTYTTTCDSTTTSVPACPKKVPDGYSVVFSATFVEPDGDLTAQSYNVVPVPSTYDWEAGTPQDLPPSQILEFSIRVEWTRGGETKSSQLKTLISDRKFGEVKLRGNAKVDYGIEVQTGYVDPAGASSLLTATAGKAESLIESKTTSTSNQTSRSAELRLTELPPDASVIGADIAFTEGAKGIYHAPPNSSPADVSLLPQTLTHPDLDPASTVAGFDDSRAKDIDVAVTNELPIANGAFELGDPGSSSDDLWMAPQVSTDTASDLQLNTSRPMFFMHPGGTDIVIGESDAVATAIDGSDRKVQATAQMSLDDVRILPTNFIASSETEGAVVVIDSFTASVNCNSTADPATADKSATWSATLRYWQDTTNNGEGDGSYQTVTLSGAESSDPLADLQAGPNPLVYDGPTLDQDVYLFDDLAAGQVGYLTDWGSLFNASSTGVTEDAAGQVTTAAIDGALSINTVPTGATPDSGLNIDVGKLNCEAVDRR